MSPIEWLNRLVERPDGYRKLVDESGDVTAAAWRLAQAKCRARDISNEIPTRGEVRAAMKELYGRMGIFRNPPPPGVLASVCESNGLLTL